MRTAPTYAGASPGAIEHHYDVSNDFYGLWLDESLTYSCALWDADDPTDTLERAQVRKLDHLIEGARAAGASRVLDIGCGWGALLDRLVSVHGVEHAVGLTLSPAQAGRVNARGDARLDVRVENWADHVAPEPYDAIISIGAFEHFASFGLPRAEREAAYRRFFTHCRDLLAPGGRLALQTNLKGNNVRLDRATVAELRFVADTVFPESEIPWMSEITRSSEKLFDVVSARNDPEHYARTCAEWYRRLMDNRERAVELVGESVVDDYERYLSSTVRHFDARHLGLARIVFTRV
jgi:cyclopropane-fatty-acyl-phospholipid synthase